MNSVTSHVKRLLVIQNIINPYRRVLFNSWSDDCSQKQIELHVALMAHSEPYRRWQSRDYPLRCPHTFYHDFPLHIPGFYRTHLNPGVWRDLLLGDWDIVIIAGYDHLTSAIASCLPKRQQIRLLWTESNAISAKRTGGASVGFKKRILQRFDGFVVPGKLAKDQVLNLWSAASQRPFLRLPNVIDFPAFAAQRNISKEETARRRERWGLPLGDRVILFVGQLDHRKAMDRFLSATLRLDLKGLTVVLIGEGELAGEMSRLAAESQSIKVKLLGYQNEEVVREILGCCDAFVLPSLADPWPLVLVEAVTAGLPLLVSSRVGNWIDVMEPGKNGWLFDVMDPQSIQAAARELATASEERLITMRTFSGAVADKRFRTESVLSAFNLELLELCNKRGQQKSARNVTAH